LPAGTKHEQDFLLVPGDNLASRLAAYLLVKDAAAPALDRVLESMPLERRHLASIAGVIRRELVHWHQRAPHGMLRISLGNFGVATDAVGITEVLHSQPSVSIGRV
jgi:hypothetical protein